MPRLYCAQHGKEYEADTAKNQERYRQEHESVLIVKGMLISGPWLCDRCNDRLYEGMKAYLFSSFTRWVMQYTSDYDFEYERRYFDMENSKVAVYGVEWPGGSLSGR